LPIANPGLFKIEDFRLKIVQFGQWLVVSSQQSELNRSNTSYRSYSTDY